MAVRDRHPATAAGMDAANIHPHRNTGCRPDACPASSSTRAMPTLRCWCRTARAARMVWPWCQARRPTARPASSRPSRIFNANPPRLSLIHPGSYQPVCHSGESCAPLSIANESIGLCFGEASCEIIYFADGAYHEMARNGLSSPSGLSAAAFRLPPAGTPRSGGKRYAPASALARGCGADVVSAQPAAYRCVDSPILA